MQANSIICTGSARFLNKINGACTDGTSGTTKYMRQDGTWQVPPNDNTDTKVAQTASDEFNTNYEVLLSGSADNTTRTEGARKSSGFIYNPNKQNCLIGSLKSSTPLGKNATAFGYMVEATGEDSHAEGAGTTASGGCSHAEGINTIANHKSQHVFGEYNIADPSTAAATARGNYVEIVGNGTTDGTRSNARTLDWSGNEWIASTLVVGTLKSGTTLGTNATAFGDTVEASGDYSHAEGWYTTASGQYGAHAEGVGTTASGQYGAHAEGVSTTASQNGTHAEGTSTIASGQLGAHAEGNSTTASGDSSHAEGYFTNATGIYSHAEGNNTIALVRSNHVFGEYNVEDTSYGGSSAKGDYIEIVGNGTSNTARSNARTLNWSGNEWLAGTLTQGSSIEIKKNVADMTQEDGDKILNLRPVVFDYKSSEKDIQAERGFIAEEVKEIIPNLVTDKIVNDEGETVAPASLNYISMIPYLVKVCQRQQKEIDELKSLIAEK